MFARVRDPHPIYLDRLVAVRPFILLADDVHAQFDALVANEHGRAGDELAHLVLALAAECAMERFLAFAAADLVHLRTPTRYKSSQP